jgi:hypothetical protein
MRKFMVTLIPLLMLVLTLGASAAQAAPADAPNDPSPHPVPQVSFTLDGVRADAAQLKAHDGRPLHSVVDQQGNLAIFTTEANANQHIQQLSLTQAGAQPRSPVATRAAAQAPQAVTPQANALTTCYPPLTGYTTLHLHINWCGQIVDLNKDVSNLNVSPWFFNDRASSIDNARGTWTAYYQHAYYQGSVLYVAPNYSVGDLRKYGFNDIISSVNVDA